MNGKCPTVKIREYLNVPVSKVYFRTNITVLSICFLVLLPLGSLAQTNTLNGVVDNAKGELLEGALVEIKGTNHQVVTDQNGKFSLQNASFIDKTLVINHTGYETQEVSGLPISENNSELGITLVQDSEIGDERFLSASRHEQSLALSKQREALSITSVMATEHSNYFADYTVRDALIRIPGIQASRTGDINIRGVGLNRYNVTVDGQRMGSTGLGDRSVDLGVFSLDMIRDLEVIKVITPDMDANAMAGVINMNTRLPANVERNIDVRAGSGANSHYFNHSGPGSRASLRYQDSPMENLSIGINLNYQNDNRAWESLEIDYGLADFGDGPVDVLNRVSPFIQNEESNRLGGGLHLVFQPSDRDEYHFRGLVNNDDRTLVRHAIGWFTGDPELWTDQNTTGNQGGFGYDVTLRETNIKQYTVQAGARHHFDLINLEYNIGWAYGQVAQQLDRAPFHLESLDYSIDWEERNKPSFLVTNIPLQHDGTIDAQRIVFQNFDRVYDNHVDNKYSANIDLEVPLSLGSIKIGTSGLVSLNSGDFSESSYNYLRRLTMDRFSMVRNGKFTVLDESNYFIPRFVDPYNVRDFYYGNRPIFSQNESRYRQNSDIWNYDALENIFAGYGMSTIDVGGFTVTAGARLEYSNSRYDGRTLSFDDIGTFITSRDTSQTNSFMQLFPNAQLKYSIGNETNIRMAYSRTIDRPDLNLLAPFSLRNFQDSTIFRGNAELKPMLSDNLDLMVDHYFRDNGQVSVGLFYKELSNFIYEQQQTITQGDDAGWNERSIVNGDETATIYGIEVSWIQNLSFLPGFLGNFGTYANYTWSHSEYEVDSRNNSVALPYMSPHVVNAALNYNQGRFYSQLSYHWTGLALTGLQEDTGLAPSINQNEPIYQDMYQDGWTDLSYTLRFRISDNFQFWFDISNLLDKELVQYDNNRDYYTRSILHRNGRELNLGINYKF